MTPAQPAAVASGSAVKGAPLTLDEGDWNFNQLDVTKAPIASPVFTGNPQAPNPPAGDSSQSVVTTSWFMANLDAGTY